MSANSRSYQIYRLLDHLVGGEVPAQRFHRGRSEASVREIEMHMSSQKQKPVKEIPRVRNISDDDFQSEYVKRGLPVVLHGKAKDWKCVENWSMPWLRENYGSDEVSIFDPLASSSSEVRYDVEVTDLSTVLDAIESGDNSKYSRFNRLLYDHPELVRDFDWEWLQRARSSWSSGKTYQVFIGGKGTRTSLHCAGEHNLFTQVEGRKHWHLIEPSADIWLDPPITRTPYFYSVFDPASADYTRFPGMEYAQVWECLLEPGDVLFNPPFWWHQVTNTTPSIGVGFRWFDLLENIKINAVGTAMTLMSTNPPIWTATKHRTDFAAIFKQMQSEKTAP
ncbi:MAG: cupin-like domain-containing protein [Flavobacteriales bacterium]|nr:cupin-like domain-containing protein [Flavobacteriales bacterium]